ncbi:MAG: PEP-utilizing enzyme [bacterium]
MNLINIFTREYSVQYTEVSIRSLGYEVKKYIPKLVLSQAYIPERDNNQGCYADKNEWKIFLGSLNKKYSDKNRLSNFLLEFHKYGDGYVDTAKKTYDNNLGVIDNDGLKKYYIEYQKKLIIYTVFLWVGFLLNNIYSDKIKTLLEKKGAGNLVGSILTPTKLSGILKLQDKLVKIKKNGNLEGKELSKLLKKYAWMSCLDVHNDPWTEKDLIDFYNNLKSPEQASNFTDLIEKIKLDEEELKLIRLARELVYVKDMRDEYRRQGVYYSIPLFTEIAKRLGVSRKELAYFTQNEIIKALKNDKPLNKKISVDRQNGFLIYWNDKKIYITSKSQEIAEFVKKNTYKQDGTTKSLKGTVASAGLANGKVRIISGIKDLNKVKKGDIMVAITTHPDYVPAMHRANAIITDEGGLTSHAAIVSRELKIPCIVGTKMATRILKDGDIVEVDANVGLILLMK